MKPIEARFAQPGGTIGRSSHNMLTLPDPERHISRTQAEVVVEDDGFMIKNVGSANPIMVRGRTVAVGEMVPLAHGDRLRIGGYSLEAIDPQLGLSVTPDVATEVMPRVAARAEGDERRPAPRLDDWPMMEKESARDSSAGARPGSFAERVAGSFEIDVAPADGTRPRPFDGLITGIEVASHSDDPLKEFLANRSAPVTAELPPTAARDSDRAPLDTRPSPLGAWPSTTNEAPPDVPASLQPELVPIRVDTPVVPSLASADTEAMWRAFCEGARIHLDPVGGPNPELMRIAGALLRNAIDGTLQMVEVRSALRYELHAQITVIKPRNNNPLKFAADARSALEQLLEPPLRGFLPGPAAMADVMHDLVGHAIGTVAGTRAALEGVLARFAPDRLEAQLSDNSVLDSVLPMNRKAKLWELYLLHYESIRGEAQQDFHTLFGKAFLEAYDEQLERLKRDKGGGAT